MKSKIKLRKRLCLLILSIVILLIFAIPLDVKESLKLILDFYLNAIIMFISKDE